jgi:short-subunit dehydrogenase
MFFSPLNPPINDWTKRRLWIIGASSGIGAACAEHALALGAHVALSARRGDALAAVAQGHVNSLVLPFDACDTAAWQGAFDQLMTQWSSIDMVLFCVGTYEPMRSWHMPSDTVRATFEANLLSVYQGLHTVLPQLMAQSHGSVAITASVAGYLGLPNATAYGPSKAALIQLAEILYGDLHPFGLGVYLINPGFVQSRLTAKNTFAMPALQTPKQAAHAIFKGFSQGRFDIHFPLRFSLFLKCLQILPYRWRFKLLTSVFKETENERSKYPQKNP